MGIGASVLLIAIGAILAFAMSIDPTPVAGLTIEWPTVGVILMIAGLIGLIWSVMVMSSWRDRRDRDDVVRRERVEHDRIIDR